MARISKDPAVRKQELIDVAKKMFFTKGYEATSIRGILKEVDGASGMFYYYFKSKDEIYKEAMTQYITEYISVLSNTLYSKELPISDRVMIIFSIFRKTFLEVLNSDNSESEGFRIVLTNMVLKGLVKPVKDIIEEAIQIELFNIENLTIKNTENLSIAIVYGICGIMDNVDRADFDKNSAEEKLKTIPLFVSEILGIPPESLFKGEKKDGIN